MLMLYSTKRGTPQMRNRIVELAAGNNALFDELGEMPDLRRFIKIYADDPYFAEDKIKVQELHKTLHCILTDPNYPETKDDLNACLELFPVESVDSDFKGEGWQDGFSVGFGITDSEEPELICHGIDEGPMNGINPYIYINCFFMNDPDKKYSFHLANGFAEMDYRSGVYLELEKVAIE